MSNKSPFSFAWLPQAVQHGLLLLAVAFLFGSSFILIKRSLQFFTPLQVAAWRIATAWLFFLPLAWRYRRRWRRKQWPYLLYVGLMGNLLPSVLFAVAQTHIDSSLAGMMNLLTPLFTLLVGWLIFRVHVPWQQVAGILTGLVGALLLIYSPAQSFFSGISAYALLAAAAILSIASSMNVVKYRLPGLHGAQVAAFAFVLVGPLAVGILLASPLSFNTLFSLPPAGWLYPIVLGITASFLPVIGVNVLVQQTNPLFSSSVTYIIPIVAIFWGLHDGEQLFWWQWLGMAVVLAGVLLIRRK